MFLQVQNTEKIFNGYNRKKRIITIYKQRCIPLLHNLIYSYAVSIRLGLIIGGVTMGLHQEKRRMMRIFGCGCNDMINIGFRVEVDII